MSKLGAPTLRLGLPGQGRVINLEALALDDSDVGRDSVPELDLEDVTDDEVLRLNANLVPLPESEGVLRHHVGERFHDL